MSSLTKTDIFHADANRRGLRWLVLALLLEGLAFGGFFVLLFWGMGILSTLWPLSLFV